MMEHVYRINTGASNAYLIENGDKSILIDVGNKNKAEKILKAISDIGLEPASIAVIVLTHAHYDHVGSLPVLKERTGAKVIAHETDKDSLLAGYTDLPKGTNPFFQFIISLARTFFKNHGSFDPVEPDILINEKYDLSEFGVDAFIQTTPGHTAGSVSLILEGKHAFVGDTAFNIRRKSVYPPFANNEKELIQSWKVLLDTGVEYFWPGHGKMFTREKFLKTYQKVAGENQ
ncbi:MAG: MBL fold metallo-hydrolase [Bacteroidales bacterium]